MLPTFTTLDPTYGAFGNAIIGSDKTLETCVGANGPHLLKGQFGRAAAFAAIRRAVAYSVGLVGLGRVPSQVRKIVVPGVSVIVTAFHSIRSWANKCCKHQCVRSRCFWLVALPQQKEGTIVSFMLGKRFDFSGFHGAYTTAIRNFVKAFKANDREPVFHSPTMGKLKYEGNS